MKQLFRLLLLVLILASGTLPAMAATSQEESNHVKEMVSAILADKKAEFHLHGRELKTEGSVLVEPGDRYYAVTTPHLSVVESDGASTDIGILAINAMPGKTPREWSLTIAIPTPIVHYDAQKKVESRVNIGAQTLSGVWNEDAASFLKLDARYEKIEIQNVQEGVTVKIPRISVLYNLAPGADGKTWSGPVSYSLDQMEISRAGSSSLSKIGRIEANVFVRDYSPAAMQEYRSKVRTASKSITDGTAPIEHMQGIYSLIFDSAGTLWDGFDSNFIARDIDIAYPQPNAGGTEGRLKLKQAGMNFNVSGLRNNQVSITAKTNYDGLIVTPPPAGFSESTPSRLDLSLTIDKIPFKELIDLGRTTLQPDSSSPEQAKMAGMRAVTLVPELLTAAGTTLTINPSSLGNSSYEARMNGSIVSNLKAVMGAQGKGKIEITGLGKMTALLNEKLKNQTLSPESRKAMKESLVTMTVIQTIGQKKEGVKDSDLRVYDIELTEDGKLTLNGTDLSALQTLIGAAKKK